MSRITTRARASALALSVSLGLMAFAPAAFAEEKAAGQAVTIKNSTIETTTRINGVINQTVTGSGNTADMNFGADIRGANVENSRISSTVRINGVVSNVVTGSGNTSTINFGLKAGS